MENVSRRARFLDFSVIGESVVTKEQVGHLDEVDDRQNAEFELLVREQTPSSMTDPTPFASPDEFEPLLRVKQLILLRPHLHAIIQEDFKPARQRIDGFFEKASNSRASMADVRFGDIRAEEITEIIMPELERWALRGDRWESIQVRDILMMRLVLM